MLNIRQWYYILRRDSKFLLACVLLSPSVNEEVFSQQFTHHNLKIYRSCVQKLLMSLMNNFKESILWSIITWLGLISMP